MATQSEVARHLDLSSARYVRELLDRGVLPRGPGGTLDLEACRTAYIRHLRERAAGRQAEEGTFDLVEERARLAKEQADQTAMKNAEMRAELVRVDEVEHGYIALATTVSQRMQAIPSRLAVEIATESDPSKCEELIEKEVHEALRELAEAGDGDLARELGDQSRVRARAGSASTAAEDEPAGVGGQVPRRAKGHKSGRRKVAR